MTQRSQKNKSYISKEVADMFVRIEAHKCKVDDLRRMMDWAADSPEKLEEMEELSSLYEAVGKVKPSEDIIHAPDNIPSLWQNFSRWLRPSSPILAAGLIAATIAFFVIGNVLQFGPVHQNYKTRIGEIRNVALEDGSEIYLNGDSLVTVNYQKDQRYLVLDEGEAFFEVAKDKEREFIVEVGGVLVQAVGTAFNIDYTENDVTVSVTEGTVKIGLAHEAKLPANQKSPTLYASVGERVAVKKATSAMPQSGNDKETDITQRLGAYILKKEESSPDHFSSWRSGVLHLDGAPLSTTIDRINRQSRKQIAISDVRLNPLPIYGSFRLDDTDGFIKAIEVLYPIQHIETEKGYVLIYRENS
ncbi:FecR family protein [Kordiimonas sp.]|uniref:FecR family protein n=1 Tax=Kordiimonas sp. TaxID=1970157 RepID=UPI003B51D06D